MKVSVNLNLLPEGVLDRMDGMCEHWAAILNQTKPLNPINDRFEWSVPSEVLIHIEQTSPKVEVDAIGKYAIYALFAQSEMDNIKAGNGKGITFLAFINGRLCVLADSSIGWVQIESIQATETLETKGSVAALINVRNRLLALDNTKQYHPDVLLNVCDITDALDIRQIKRNGFSACFADILQVMASTDNSGMIDIPLLDIDCKVLEGKSVTAEVLRSHQSNMAMVTIDLPAGVGVFMSKPEVDFPLQVLEKHPIDGSIRSRSMSYWSGGVGGFQFNWRCPTTITFTLKV